MLPTPSQIELSAVTSHLQNLVSKNNLNDIKSIGINAQGQIGFVCYSANVNAHINTLKLSHLRVIYKDTSPISGIKASMVEVITPCKLEKHFLTDNKIVPFYDAKLTNNIKNVLYKISGMKLGALKMVGSIRFSNTLSLADVSQYKFSYVGDVYDERALRLNLKKQYAESLIQYIQIDDAVGIKTFDINEYDLVPLCNALNQIQIINKLVKQHKQSNYPAIEQTLLQYNISQFQYFNYLAKAGDFTLMQQSVSKHDMASIAYAIYFMFTEDRENQKAAITKIILDNADELNTIFFTPYFKFITTLFQRLLFFSNSARFEDFSITLSESEFAKQVGYQWLANNLNTINSSLLIILLKNNVIDIKKNIHKGKMLIHYACQYGKLSLANYLLSQYDNKKEILNKKSDDGKTPIYYLLQNNHWELFFTLNNLGGSVDIAVQDKPLILDCAGSIINFYEEQVLSAFGIHICSGQVLFKHARFEQPITPLSYFALQQFTIFSHDPTLKKYISDNEYFIQEVFSLTKNYHIARMIVDIYTDFDFYDKQGRSPLFWAVKNGWLKEAISILNKSPKLNLLQNKTLVCDVNVGCQRGNNQNSILRDFITLCAQHEVDLSSLRINSYSPLLWASTFSAQSIRPLIKCGNVLQNKYDKKELDPVYNAFVQKNHIAAINLIKLSNVFSKNTDEITHPDINRALAEQSACYTETLCLLFAMTEIQQPKELQYMVCAFLFSIYERYNPINQSIPQSIPEIRSQNACK